MAVDLKIAFTDMNNYQINKNMYGTNQRADKAGALFFYERHMSTLGVAGERDGHRTGCTSLKGNKYAIRYAPAYIAKAIKENWIR